MCFMGVLGQTSVLRSYSLQLALIDNLCVLIHVRNLVVIVRIALKEFIVASH